MKGGKRLFWYVLIAVTAAVVIEYMGYQSAGVSVSPVPTKTPKASTTPKATAKPTPPPSGAMPTSYSDAVNQYKDGKRIQFDMYCHANPSAQTFKSGTSIMLDNRSGDARIVSVGGTQYSLSGYGWTIVNLSARSLPSTLLIGCGSATNVGNIVLQP